MIEQAVMERAVIEYIANALWQVPLLAGGAWLLLWAVRCGPQMQHRVWLAVLGLAVVLPVYGMGSAGELAVQARQIAEQTRVVRREQPKLFVGPSERRRPEPRSLQTKPTLHSVRLTVVRLAVVRLTATAAHWLVAIYLSVVFLALLRIGRGWRTARHLVMSSREAILLPEDRAALMEYGRRLGIRLPEVCESGAVSSPMIVGAMKAVLLLPEGFCKHTIDEVKAALWHELAHVKRRDYLTNLICQVVALPVAWHPVMHGIQRRIRRTREMICDAMAAEQMRSEIGYARCLLTMAQSMLRGAVMSEQVEVGLFGSNVLEERVTRLMETKTVLSVRAKVARVASGITAMAAMFHVTPIMAERDMVAQTATAQSSTTARSAAMAVQQSPVEPQAVSAAPNPKPSAALAADAQASEPAPTPEPAPTSTPAPLPQPVVQPDGVDANATIILDRVDGEVRHLTPEERQRVDREIATAMAKIHSSEIQRQIAEARRQADEAVARVNSAEFKQEINDAVQVRTKVENLLKSPEFVRQIEEVQQQAEKIRDIELPKVQQQIDEAIAKVNSAEFQKQMATIQLQIQTGEIQREMDKAMQQLKEAQTRLGDPQSK